MVSRAQIANIARTGTAVHPLYRDVALTGATTVVVSVAGLLVVSMIGRWMGRDAVAEYLLVRRVATWLIAGVLMGMSVALPRYVAQSARKSGGRETYFLVATLLAGGLAVLLAIALNAAWHLSSRLLFGNGGKHLVLPLSLLIVAHTLHALVFGFYRGCLSMKRANALQLMNFALVPLAAVGLFWRQSIATIVVVMAVAVLLSSLLMALPVLPAMANKASRRLRGAAAQLFRYGLARVPGDFGSSAMFTVGPIIAAAYVPMHEVAYLLLGLSMLNVIGTSVNPLNQVLLSAVSAMLGEGRYSEARVYIQYLLGAVLECAIFLCLQVLVFADVIVRIWVGPQFSGHMLLLRILLVCIPFYLFYTALRSAIDAASVKAYNAHNILVALGIFLSLAGASTRLVPANWLLEAIAGAMLLAIMVLSCLTGRTVWQLYELKPAWNKSARPLLLAAALGLVAFVFRWTEGFKTWAVEFGVFEVLVSGVFLFGLRKIGSNWLGFILQTLIQKKVSDGASDDEQIVLSA